MPLHDHISEAVKAPTLVRLTDNLIVARFETMKIASALHSVKSLLESGTIKPGDTVIDSSSGIYAYSLALACHRYGLHCYIVGSTTIDRPLKTQLEILGATLEQVRPSASLKLDQTLRVRRIREILAENPTFHWMKQYHDPIHYEGYRDIARLITESLHDEPLAIVGGVGSGASTGGLVTALRDDSIDVHSVGIQPFGSVTFGSESIHDPEVIIAGIGSSIPFKNVHHDLYDEMHWLSFDTALSGSVALLREHALFAGLSSGASYAVASYIARATPGRQHVFIAADTGHRYVDAVFARHEEATPLAELAPIPISTLSALVMPWSSMAWNRRLYEVPENA